MPTRKNDFLCVLLVSQESAAGPARPGALGLGTPLENVQTVLDSLLGFLPALSCPGLLDSLSSGPFT